jgi:hypothetical protein
MNKKKQDEAEEILDELLKILPHAEISMHVPGKIKLKLKVSGLPVVAGIDLEAISEMIPGILETKSNWLTRSVEIRYDPERVPHEAWESIIELKEKPQNKPSVHTRLKALLDEQSA